MRSPNEPFDFTHVVMTRFNLATPGRELAIRNQPGWLEGRFRLFEDYCLPSMAAQTSAEFHWVIYFDENTPAEFRDRIAKLQKIAPFEAHFTGLFPAEGWRRSIREVIDPQTPLLLTTRLDNDDALSRDFVARLHTAVRNHGLANGSYNFRNGLIRRGGALYALSHPRNAFFSWLEPISDEMRTAPSIQHMTLPEIGPVHQIGGSPGWLQVVHETNVSNKVRGRRVDRDVASGLFPDAVLDGIEPISPLARHMENLGPGLLRRTRDALGLLRRHRRY